MASPMIGNQTREKLEAFRAWIAGRRTWASVNCAMPTRRSTSAAARQYCMLNLPSSAVVGRSWISTIGTRKGLFVADSTAMNCGLPPPGVNAQTVCSPVLYLVNASVLPSAVQASGQ